MSTFATNLGRALALAEISADGLDKLIDRPRGSTALLLLKGTDPRTDIAALYPGALGVSLDWLAGNRPDLEPTGEQIKAAIAAAREGRTRVAKKPARAAKKPGKRKKAA